MYHPYWMLLNFFIAYITFFIFYQLASAFIDRSPSLRQTLLPVLIAAAIADISKICLEASAPVHTVMVVIICAGVLWLFNPIHWVLSLIGSLLTVITVILGSMILACPIFVKLGYTIPSKLSEYSWGSWILLNLLELFLPTLVLVILKISKFSLLKYLQGYTAKP